MKDFITVRIYFENGQKIHSQSWWKNLFASDFATQLLKHAKASDLQQALHLHVDKGYFDKGKIQWASGEIRHFKHPHIIEITDTKSKVHGFLDQHKALLQAASPVLVKNETLLYH
ncbi:hypothetical protein BFP72_09055 [Reichenbachiella sp. 5M10]|uniref:DUF190 domain-containing protein n=1 Tax=Reichenbachiella sp. 5M10 TaxID=1889772 RepID=UPI000C1548AF|nr:DUF190 domain-containing protein [Reichenbachiella sp. 5M10]PIB35528.1 hypothetical protein BFP72_09055 [Reichenbachiella sp. 5M10]